MHPTLPRLQPTDFPAIRRGRLETLQVNLGYLCNLSCVHCHVAAGPNRTELMDAETIDTVVEFLRTQRIRTLDLTGGSPKMNPHFRDLVIVHGTWVFMSWIAATRPFSKNLATNGWPVSGGAPVEMVASLPCYTEHNVDANAARPCSSEASGPEAPQWAGLRPARKRPEAEPGLQSLGPSLPPAQEALEVTTGSTCAMNTASTSIGYSRLRTCRSSASAASSCRNISSATT